jgi:hypothetical protein
MDLFSLVHGTERDRFGNVLCHEITLYVTGMASHAVFGHSPHFETVDALV